MTIEQENLELERMRIDKTNRTICAVLASLCSAGGLGVIYLTNMVSHIMPIEKVVDEMVKPGGYVIGTGVFVGGMIGAYINAKDAVRMHRRIEEYES